jgi:hypothetical protein
LPGGFDDGSNADGWDALAVRRVCEGAGRGGGRPVLAGDAWSVILFDSLMYSSLTIRV